MDFFCLDLLDEKKRFDSKNFTPTFLDPNIFLTQTILDRNFVGPKFELNLNLECTTSSPACFSELIFMLELWVQAGLFEYQESYNHDKNFVQIGRNDS